MKRILQVLALVPALVLLAAACSKSTTEGSGGAGSTRSAGAIAVAEKEFAISPAVATSAVGSVTFTITNDGAVEHEFVVLQTDTAAADLAVQNNEASEDGDIGEAEAIAPGATKSLTLNLAAGHYVLICNIPGHYQSGMHADFSVGA